MGRDTVVYALAIAIDRILGLLMLPVLTRLLSPVDYGAWSQTGVAAGLLVVAMLYAFPTIIVRRYAVVCRHATRLRAFDRLGLLSLALGLGIGLGVLAVPSWVARLVYGGAEYGDLVPALFLWALADAGAEFALAWWRTLGRIDIVAVALILRSVVRASVAIYFATSVADSPLASWFLYYAIIVVALSGVFIFLSRKTVKETTKPGKNAGYFDWRAHLLEATPLVTIAAATSLGSSLDRYLLTGWLGLDVLASYATASSLAAIPFMFHSVLGYTLFPTMSRQWASGQHAEAIKLMNQSLLMYLFLSLPVALAMTGMGVWLLPWLTTAHYQIDMAVFAGLSLSVVSMGVQQILLYGLLLQERGSQILRITLISIVMNFTLTVLLVPSYGTAGAASAMALANLSLVAWTARVLSSSCSWSFPWQSARRILFRALLCALPLFGVVILGGRDVGLMLAITAIIGLIYFVFDLCSKKSLLRHFSFS